MGKDSDIQWTRHTFNPFRGCVEVSPGCANCYAREMAKINPAVLGRWGSDGTRVVAAERQWRSLPFWNADSFNAVRPWSVHLEQCRRTGADPVAAWEAKGLRVPERSRVFCASIADVFEDWRGPMLNSAGVPMNIRADGTFTHEQTGDRRPLEMQDVRFRLFEEIEKTTSLDWLLLTKRPENVLKMVPAGWLRGRGFPDNVAIGTTVENQAKAAERLPILRRIPARVRFVSAEPLLDEVTLDLDGIHWVIVGGESGDDSRAFNLRWARAVKDQCRAAGVAFFMKQLGSRPIFGGDFQAKTGPMERLVLLNHKGGDPAEWPEDLNVRELPRFPLFPVIQ